MEGNKKDYLYYFNKFLDWEDAENYCKTIKGGYSQDYILEAVAKANNEVIRGNALYEQDGVVYTKEHNNYELLFALFYIYSIEKCLKVCDFGGALGSTYRRYRSILPSNTEWNVIEQSNYVDYGIKNIHDIAFYYNLEECVKKNEINVILFSSSIQYLADPYKILLEASNITNYILIDETSFQRNDTDTEIWIQHIPAYFYGREAYYPVHIFNREEFIESMGKYGYKKKFEWLYDGNGMGIPIHDDGQIIDTIDRGFLMIK